MKKKGKDRVIKINRENREWKLQQQFGRLTDQLNRLPDANEIQRNPIRSAPLAIAEMVF